tara:strand:- start:71 stop:223 length:153 start_codon:yes stop_codon:yes gene_type:complete
MMMMLMMIHARPTTFVYLFLIQVVRCASSKLHFSCQKLRPLRVMRMTMIL